MNGLDILKPVINRRMEGFNINLTITDALNTYGRIERYTAEYNVYQISCTRCGHLPNRVCVGQHSLEKRWVTLRAESGYTDIEAANKLVDWYNKNKPVDLPVHKMNKKLHITEIIDIA